MDTYHWLLTFHITSAFFLVGASVAAGILNGMAVVARRPSDAAALLRLIRRVLPLLFAGVLGTFAFGVALWHERGYGLGAGWIWASLVLWLVSNALGGIGGRHQERARELAERLAADGDTTSDELRALLRDPRGNAMSWAAGAATVAILVLMLWKP